MPQFVFTSSQGRFPIPDGESRVGSDTTCQVCIQGEGVLPVHAYLKADGDKLMLRPSSEKSPVFVEGQPVGGPFTLLDGQTVSIGPLQLKLEAQGHSPQPLLKKRWFRILLYTAGGLAALVLLAVLLRLLWFNDNWFRARIVAQVDAALQRDDTEIEAVQVGLFEGRLTIRNLRVPNREPIEARDLLHVEEIAGELDPWTLCKSWLAGPLELRATNLKLLRPKLFIERYERNGRPASNVDDILARYLEGPPRKYPIDLGLGALEGSLTVEGGEVLLNDQYTQLGKTQIEGLTVRLEQQGLGRELRFEARAAMRADDRDCGTLALLQGQSLFINQAGMIDTKDIGNGSATLKLDRFDLARLFSHLQWSFPVNHGEQRVVLGKPVTGEFRITFHDLQNFLLTGSAESESLVSVLEKSLPPVGNIPTRLDVDLNYSVQHGPTEISLVLRSASSLGAVRDPGQPQMLVLRADGKRDPAGNYRYDLKLKAVLQDLFATDVGDRLKLKGRLRGALEGDAAITFAKGEMKIDGSLSQRGEAFVPHPSDPQGKGEWIPTNVKAECTARALPNERGEISNLEARFKANADSKSFEAESLAPAHIENLDRPEKLKINTQFKLNLMGREFWQEFGTYMKLLGFSDPVEERLDLKVTVYSGRDGDDKPLKIGIGLRGKTEAQWNPALPPVELLAHLEYLPELASSASVAPPPYLKLTLQTGDKTAPPFVRIEDAELTRTVSRQTLTVPLLLIESDLQALRERFDPYFRRIAAFLGTSAYEQYLLKGSPRAQSKLSLAWDAEPAADGSRALEAAYEFAVEGENLSITGPVPRQAPQKPGETPRQWTWLEPQPVFHLKGGYRRKPAASKEEPDFHRLDLDEFEMQGSLGAFKLRAKDLDLWLLDKLTDRKARLPGKVLPDALREFGFSGTVEAAAFDLLRRLELLPADPFVTGQLKLQADYKRETGRLALRELVFANPEKNGFWLKELDAVAGLRGFRDVFLAWNAAGGGLATSLLEHLDEFLIVKSLTLDAEGFRGWVQAKPELAIERGFPDTLVRPLAAKRLAPLGTWTIKDLALRPATGRDRTWSIVGQFRNDFTYKLPGEGEASRAREFVLKGPWSISEKDASAISFTEDYQNVSVLLNAGFELAEVALLGALPEWSYHKPAGQPLAFSLQASHSPGGANRDTILYMDSAALKGGPLRAELSGAELRTKLDTKNGGEGLKSLSIQQARLDGGPLGWAANEPCTMEKLAYDGETNQLRGSVRIPRVDVAYLAALGIKPVGFTAQGAIAGLVCEFNGDLDRLRALDPQPTQDKLDIKGELKDLRIAGVTATKEPVYALFNGAWAMSNSELNSMNLEVALSHTAGAGGPAPRQSLLGASLEGLWVASRDEKKNLRQALLLNAMPLNLKLPMRFKTPIDTGELDGALAALKSILSGRNHAPPREANPYEFLATLNVDGSLSAPAFRSGALKIGQFVAPKFALKDMKLAVPMATGLYANGALTVSAFNADLSTATGEFPFHVKHTYGLKLLKAEVLRLLFGDQQGPSAGHRLDGQLSMEGMLAGAGFELAARRSWQGGVEADLQGLVLDFSPEPQKTERVERRPAWARDFSPDAAVMLTLLLSKPSAKASDLLRCSPVLAELKNETEALTKAAIFSLELYLARFGLNTARLELEPCKLLVTVTNGIAEFKPAAKSRMAAKGTAAGLELRAEGRVRLWDMGIEDALRITAIKLPDAWQEKLALALWPQEHREEFLKDLESGVLALRISGSLDAPQFEFPAERLARHAMLAVFGQEKIKDAAAFDAALAYFRISKWAQTDADTTAAARLLDRLGVALPGTETHKLSGASMLDRATGLPPHIRELVSPLVETLTPEQSLLKLLAPPPLPPKSSGGKEAGEKGVGKETQP